jgi:Allene oxide cyclase
MPLSRRLRFALLGSVALLAAFALPAAAATAKTIHVVERATTDAVTNGSEEDRAGNVLTWHNKIYDAKNKHRVGRDAGYCVRIVVGKSWECSWTTFLKTGSISVQGPFSDSGNTVLAITGGTGSYAGASGTMNLEYRNKKGTAFDFVFHLRK